VPNGATASAFWSSARQNDGHYLSFLVSFLAVAAAWSDHHDAFTHARRTDRRLRNLNMIWLLAIILIPFATKLLTGYGNDDLTVHAFLFGFYALLQVLLSAALLAMARHLISHHLQEPGTEEKDRRASGWRSYGPLLGFGLSIPVFFATTYAWVLWIAVPLLVLPLRRLQRRDQSAPEGRRLTASPSTRSMRRRPARSACATRSARCSTTHPCQAPRRARTKAIAQTGSDGTVSGGPRAWLRAEAAVALAGASPPTPSPGSRGGWYPPSSFCRTCHGRDLWAAPASGPSPTTRRTPRPCRPC
jgi:uncharacterized membrane protein